MAAGTPVGDWVALLLVTMGVSTTGSDELEVGAAGATAPQNSAIFSFTRASPPSSVAIMYIFLATLDVIYSDD